MSEVGSWTETIAGQLARVMGGARPGTAEPLRPQTEGEVRARRRAWETEMDSVDKRLNLTGAETWRARREQAERALAEAMDHGRWYSSVTDCTQCRAEERGLVFDKPDHECVIEDLRLQMRLNNIAKIRQAELDGGIRHNVA